MRCRRGCSPRGKAQNLDNTEHSRIPFIEKFRSIKEAVAKFGRI